MLRIKRIATKKPLHQAEGYLRKLEFQGCLEHRGADTCRELLK